jgi:hypothetical protein
MGLFDALGDSYSLTVFAFVLIATSIYANGGSFSDSIFFGWLGLIGAVPFAIGSALGASAGAFVPFIALALVVYCGLLQRALGPVALLVWVGYVALTLGA